MKGATTKQTGCGLRGFVDELTGCVDQSAPHASAQLQRAYARVSAAWLGRSAQPERVLNRRTVAATRGEGRAVGQDDQILAVQHRAKLSNCADVDGVRSMYTQECRRVKPIHQTGKRFLVEVRPIRPQSDVVVLGLDANDIAHL